MICCTGLWIYIITLSVLAQLHRSTTLTLLCRPVTSPQQYALAQSLLQQYANTLHTVVILLLVCVWAASSDSDVLFVVHTWWRQCLIAIEIKRFLSELSHWSAILYCVLCHIQAHGLVYNNLFMHTTHINVINTVIKRSTYLYEVGWQLSIPLVDVLYWL